MFEAGYGIGGRMDIGIRGGALLETLEGENEVVPTFSLLYSVIVLKQQKAVPFSLETGVGIGFASAIPDSRAIYGTDYGFELLLSRDFRLDRFLVGVNGVFQYDRYQYEIKDPPNATTGVIVRQHQYFYGFGIDIGYAYYEKNQVIFRNDVLWDRDGRINIRLRIALVIASVK